MGFPAQIVGNLTADLELRYTQNGLPVASGSVAVNERKFNRQTNEWEEGEATFIRISIWRELGEHAAGSLTKGSRVICHGKIDQKSYTDREGAEKQSWEMTVDEIGPSLKFATAQLTRATSSQQGGGQQGNRQGQAYGPGVMQPGPQQGYPQQGYPQQGVPQQPYGGPAQGGPATPQQMPPQGPPQQQPAYQQPQQQPQQPQQPPQQWQAPGVYGDDTPF